MGVHSKPPGLRPSQSEAIPSGSIQRLLEHRWLPVVLALVITGLGAASAALVFRTGLDGLGRWRLRMLQLGPAWLLLPAITGGGGLIAGLLVQGLAPAAQGSGIPQVMLFLRRKPIPMGFRVALVKLVAGIVAIGSGFPLGPSGPAVQMGSSMGWQLARLLRAPQPFLRLIVAAGGGAGIAAVFRAPIGGFFYTVEELLQGARPVVMLLVLVTTFWADTWADLLGLAGLQALRPGTYGLRWNPGGVFHLQRQVTTYVEVVPIDLVVLFALGALVAFAAELFCRYVVELRNLLQRWRLPLAAGMATAGVWIGFIDALLPADFINRAGIRQSVAEGNVDIPKALGIFLVLFLTTGLAAAAGTPGGLFAPMLTLGGALGLALAGMIERTGLEGPSTAVFAGMGAFLAACARTPMTATFLTFAVTKELLILKPVLTACLGSVIVARLLHPRSIFKRLMACRGLQGLPFQRQGGTLPFLGAPAAAPPRNTPGSDRAPGTAAQHR